MTQKLGSTNEELLTMNYLNINELSDLEFIIEESLNITGQPSSIKKEIYRNTWAITFKDELISNLKIQNLIERFLSALLNERTSQLFSMNPKQEAIFYLWFDEQALHLCFNFISNCHASLPFTAKLNIIDSYKPILNNFITKSRRVITEGRFAEIYKPDEFPYDDDEIEEMEKNFILDVYMKIIDPKLKPKD